MRISVTGPETLKWRNDADDCRHFALSNLVTEVIVWTMQ